MAFKYLGGYLSASYDALADGLYKGLWTLKDVLYAISREKWSGIVPVGQDQYTSSGTFSWTAPAGVTSVSVVCVGPSLKWANTARYGRGGGGLGYKNNIAVVPGNSYTVQVGDSAAGTSSYFISTATVEGQCSSGTTAGGGYTGDGGGNGGNGGAYGGGVAAGGGGAGGYSGNGGNGASTGDGFAPATNSGGGGGGAYSTSGSFGGGGGGVGIWGLGPDGAKGIYNSASNYVLGGGGGGSYGSRGSFINTSGAYGAALYGGGYPGTSASVSGGAATNGAVRIIYGNNRSFPSTNTGNL